MNVRLRNAHKLRVDQFLSCSFSFLIFLVACFAGHHAAAQKPIFEFDSSSTTKWSSFENIRAAKGKGGTENRGAKGHPAEGIEPGETKVLLNVTGAGIVNRIWLTISDRSPQMLRSVKLEMFWDGEKKPAVSVPLGDFFGMGLGKTAKYNNSLFSNPEGRSFISYLQMPYRKGAKIQVTNESSKRLSHIFFDINFQQLSTWKKDYLYFHTFWNRDTATTLAEDFEILPAVAGRGRYLGMNMGVNANPVYKENWWGEGEVKVYLDADKTYPSLVGTGTEDYIGTAWSQGEFYNDYAGCLLGNPDTHEWAFYRYHVPDPVYFKKDIRVTIQQMGSNKKEIIGALQNAGAPVLPVSVDDLKKIHQLYKGKDSVVQLDDPAIPDGYVNFYRSDDVSATCYFYLDKPSSKLPELPPLSLRTTRLKK